MIATSVIAPLCYGCTRLRDGDKTCDAYPAGIPTAILENEVDHRAPVDGDHGLRFDPVEQYAAQYAVDVFGPATATVGTVAKLPQVTELAYSPGQPRRSDGKFGTGGGGGGGRSSSGTSTAGSAGVGAGDPEEVITSYATGGKDYALKRGGPEREAQLRQWDAEGHGPYTWEAVGVREGVGDHALNAMQSEWSMGQDSHHAVLIQSSAASAGLGTGMVWGGKEGRDQQFEPSPTSTALTKAMYDRTQKRLASGPERFQVYRGVGRASTSVNVLESWTTDREIASSFGDHVMERTVPRSAVFMDNRYGGGTGGEMELVLLGSKR